MDIDEAIKSLNKELGMVRGIGMLKRIDAIKLGIEALQRISSGRNPERRYVCYLLPGETDPRVRQIAEGGVRWPLE